jgi:hypothetical protein
MFSLREVVIMPHQSLLSRGWAAVSLLFLGGLGAVAWVCSRDVRAFVANIGNMC